jgi:hypothetical protein
LAQLAAVLSTSVTNAAAKATVRACDLRPHFDKPAGSIGQLETTVGSADPAKWTETFSPDLDCTVRNFTDSGVRLRVASSYLPTEQFVRVIDLKPNLD